MLVALALMQPPDLVEAPGSGASPPGVTHSPPRSIDDILADETSDEEAEDNAAAVLLPHVDESQFLSAPAFVTDRSVNPDGPLHDRDATYQTRLLNAFQSSQGQQGPLDGRWSVANAQGAELFVLQFADPGAGESRIEGAWRNPRRSGQKGSGFIDAVTRDGDFLLVRFFEGDPDQATEVRLQPAEGGNWVGEAAGQPVLMRRTAGVETAALAAPQLAPEPRPPVAKAKARPAPKRAKAKKSRPRAAPSRARAKKK